MKDLKGRIIMVGDLVRTYHFRDRRWGHQWLYHVVVDVGEKYYEMRPVCELAFGYQKSNGGRAWLTEEMAEQVEIIHGGGPFPSNIYQERKETDAKPEPKATDPMGEACREVEGLREV